MDTQDTSNTSTEEVSEILTSEPKETKQEGKTLVFFRRKKVPENKLYRAAFVPAFDLPASVKALEGVFSVAMLDVISSAAGRILRKYEEANSTSTTIPCSLFRMDAITAEIEAAQVSERLDGASIAAWYDASATKKERDAAYLAADAKTGEAKGKMLREKFLSLASNNPGILPGLAEKMLGYIASTDVDSPVCAAVVKRLDRIKQTAVSSDEL